MLSLTRGLHAAAKAKSQPVRRAGIPPATPAILSTYQQPFPFPKGAATSRPMPIED